jgi:uncharacterized alpha-E superfamily protein
VFLRERTSNDLWQVLSTLAERLAMPAGTLGLLAGDAVGLLNQTLLSLAAFRGLARENMTRAHGWRFLDMGQRIERSIHLCAFLDHALVRPTPTIPACWKPCWRWPTAPSPIAAVTTSAQSGHRL